MRLRQGNGSIGQITGHDEQIDSRSVEIDSRSVEGVEGLWLQQRHTALTQQLHRLTQEVAESRQRVEQLEATLDKRTRRVQQLIGERDRLASMLAERDAELRQLNREHGALTARLAPAGAGSPAYLRAARAMLEKLRPVRKPSIEARSAGRQTETTERATAEAALVPWLQSRSPKPVLAVVVFGLSETEIVSVLGIVEHHCTKRGLVPLLLTDNDAFELFRGRRVLFEFLPARADQQRFAADLDWRLFTLRRLGLIRRKWQPVQIIAFGSSATDVVQLWLDSPFEATPIPAAVKGRLEQVEPGWGAARQPAAISP